MSQRYGLEIRAANAADAPGLAALLGIDGAGQGARDLAERIEQMRGTSAAALVAVAWGPPGGLVVLHWYRTLTSAALTARITTLVVAPDDRRRGIGRLLLKAASQAARTAGCDVLELLLPPERPELEAFCAATGFAPAGARLTRPLRKKGGER